MIQIFGQKRVLHKPVEERAVGGIRSKATRVKGKSSTVGWERESQISRDAGPP